jgi:hypothetical protein
VNFLKVKQQRVPPTWGDSDSLKQKIVLHGKVVDRQIAVRHQNL